MRVRSSACYLVDVVGLNYSGPNIDDISLSNVTITRCFIVSHFLLAFYSFFLWPFADEIV